MNERRAGPLRRVLRFCWNLISSLRRGIANLLFLVLIAFGLLAFLGGESEEIEDGSVLLLAPTGQVVEQRRFVDPVFRAIDPEVLDSETVLHELIKVVDAARDDSRIAEIVLDVDRLTGINLSSVLELGEALRAFRSTGKRVVALGDNYDQQQYLLASYADEIYLHSMGMVGIQGFGVYPSYYKQLLDQLLVDVHVFRVGDYKSAVEPFMRDDMSAQAKQNNLRWLQSLWDNYTATVAENRDLEAGELTDYVDNFDLVLQSTQGSAAQAALDRGLVDQVLSREDMKLRILERSDQDQDNLDELLVHYRDYLQQIDELEQAEDVGVVAVVVAEGMIVDGEQPAGVVGGDSLAAVLRDAREDEQVKAVVLRINSEGGSAFASEIIREQLSLLQQAGKPVVASMSGMAASGGYWIAAGADEIWAQPTTITGSIGIFGLFPSVYRSLAQVGVHSDGVGTTRLADAFRPDRPLSDIGSNALQAMIDQGYQRFIKLVAQARGMSEEAVNSIAQGQVWSGQDAFNRGLVDSLGGIDGALKSAAGLAELSDYRVHWMTDESWLESSLWSRLWGAVSATTGSRLSALLLGALPGVGVLEVLPSLPSLNDPAGVYLHCMDCASF